jgi:hypothetical protein
MIDTWRAQAALTRLDKALGFPRDRDVSRAIAEVETEIEALECEDEHCDDEHEDLIEPGPAQRYIHAKLSRIRLGLYRAEHDGDLLTVLEEIERILR